MKRPTNAAIVGDSWDPSFKTATELGGSDDSFDCH